MPLSAEGLLLHAEGLPLHAEVMPLHAEVMLLQFFLHKNLEVTKFLHTFALRKLRYANCVMNIKNYISI
jgi:hypothetical protein